MLASLRTARAAIGPAFRPAATFALRASSRQLHILPLTRLIPVARPAFHGAAKWFSVLTQNSAKEYKYEDIKALTQEPKPDTLLIDVREPMEFQEGHIPGALNVPFKSSPGAFDLAEDEFEESFGFHKPDKETKLVFYCLGGVRLTAAEELANSFGYANRGNYVGSWEDWVSRENAVKA